MDKRLIENIKFRINKKISMIEKFLDDSGMNKINHMKEFKDREKQVLAEAWGINIDLLRSFFIVEEIEICELNNLCLELSILSLYKILESELKSFISIAVGRDIPKFDFAKSKSVSIRLGIDIKGIENYYRMNELRLINNCIKHNDSRVSKELEKTDPHKWKKNQNIDNCYDMFLELSPLLEPFIELLYTYV